MPSVAEAIKNFRLARAMVYGRRFMRSASGAQMLGRMGTGAMVGGGYGFLDNAWGGDTSIIGGAMRGAAIGGMYHGARRGMAARFKR